MASPNEQSSQGTISPAALNIALSRYYSMSTPASSNVFSDAGDAANFLFSPEFRAAYGDASYGTRTNYQGVGSSVFFDPNEPWEEFLKKTDAEIKTASAPKVRSPGSALPQQIYDEWNKVRADKGRTTNRFYTSSEAEDARKTAAFYLDKARSAVQQNMAPGVKTPEGPRIPIQVFQDPEGNTAKKYSLKGQKPFGGITDSLKRMAGETIEQFKDRKHQFGMDNMPKVDTSGATGKELGAFLSSDPDNEIFVPKKLRTDPDYVKRGGYIRMSDNGSGLPEFVIDRPKVNKTLGGKYIPASGFKSMLGPVLGSIGTALQLKEQIDAVTGKHGNSKWDKEYGGSDPLALRAPIDAVLGNASFADTTNNPEWAMRNPLAAAIYGAAQGGNEYSKAFLEAYVPEIFKGKKED